MDVGRHPLAGRYDVVVLDVMMPKLNGVEVCRTVRAESDVPIIMLTARDAEVDRVLGLELGADDYLTKPFSLAELISRIRAVQRRRELDRAGGRATVTVGGLTLDLSRHQVVHISSLRRKIERNAAYPERIVTVRGFGYKLVPA